MSQLPPFDLAWHLAYVESWVRERFPSWPPYTHFLIVEDTDILYGSAAGPEKAVIPRTALKSPHEYHPRFEDHLDAGHSWINVNAAGVLGDAFLVIIELPSYANNIPRHGVSVNHSGPRIIGGAADLNASNWYRVSS